MKSPSLKFRSVIPDARRVVIKIGSRVLVQKTGRPDVRRMRSLIADITAIRKTGREVVVITSGAVGSGMEALGLRSRPVLLPEIQMAAAVGQTRLMSRYEELFGEKGVKVGQVLLTHSDFKLSVQRTNARRTIEALLRHGVIPIINENDVVADEELKADMAFSDNDFMAALVVKLIRADLLVILSTVDGVREPGAKGRTRRVRYLERITRKTFDLVGKSDSPLSKGGMGSKLKASQTAALSGCAVVIANGLKSGVLKAVMNGDDTGTMIVASAL
jgi:glutamate 5-kinase